MVRLTRSIARYKPDTVELIFIDLQLQCRLLKHLLQDQALSSSAMAKVKVPAPAALALLVVMAMVAGSAQATACSPQFPLSCASYVLDSRSVPLKACCIEVQDNFQLLKPTSSLNSYCEAINGVKLFNGPLTGTELSLALGIPQKCALSGQYKKGQKCNGTIMPGGS